MSTKSKSIETVTAAKPTLKLESSATTSFELVRFDELTQLPELYRHRDQAELKAGLDALIDSLIVEGQLTPIEYYIDELGRKVVLSGHRRLEAIMELIKRNEWPPDKPIKAQRVEGNPADFVCRSIADNIQRKAMTDTGTLAAVKAGIGAKASYTRLAAALGLPLSTFQRYAALARNEQMAAHVEAGDIGFSDAVKLLTQAENVNEVDQFLADFRSVVTITKGVIEEKADRFRDRTGKDLPAADRTVKKNLEAHVIKGWLSQLKDGKRIKAKEAIWTFAARIENNELIVPAVRLNLNDAPYDRIRKTAMRMNRLSQDLKPILKRRELESATSADDGIGQADLDYLESAGVKADDVREEMRRQEEARKAEVKDAEYGTVEKRGQDDAPAVAVPGVDQEEADDEIENVSNDEELED